jgi:hypothetical protein
VASLATKHLPTGRGCLCKNAHSATRRYSRNGLSFLLGTRGTQPIVCWGCLSIASTSDSSSSSMSSLPCSRKTAVSNWIHEPSDPKR